MKTVLAVIMSLTLIGCGSTPERKGDLKLFEGDTSGVGSAPKVDNAEKAAPESVAAEPSTGESSFAAESAAGQVSMQSTPKTAEEERLDQMGVDYFIDGHTIYVRERDYQAAEAAIADFASPLGWALCLRPNDEILTETGFQAPPIPVDIILAGQGITDYEIDGHVITVNPEQIGGAPNVIQILGIFYPGVTWEINARVSEPEEE